MIDLVILIECKAELKYHKSKQNEIADPEKYAVDGVLHYSQFLKQNYNVIAIAVSGENTDNLMVSNFFIRKNTDEVTEIDDKKNYCLFMII